jgi:tRNA (cytidine32/guanosine34-2'-O)-methyltransferase
MFVGHDTTFLNSQFKTLFKHVDIVKPKSSRLSSAEHFIVCRFFDPPKNFKLSTLTTFEPYKPEEMVEGFADLKESDTEVKKDNEKIFKYVTCGDLSAYDQEDGSSSDDEESEITEGGN